jgi:nitrogen fixation protein FixH
VGGSDILIHPFLCEETQRMDNLQQTAPIPAWKSPWVIGWVAGVLLVLAVNLFMVYLAVRTNPGLVVEDFYERGQHYEKTLFSRLAKDPGWHMTINLPQELREGRRLSMQFSVVDKAGVPIVPDSVTFFAYRPSNAEKDFSSPMTQVVKGLYHAEVVFGLKGVWDILVSVASGEDEYHVGQRIDVLAA